MAAFADRGGARLATELVGDQSRHGTPTPAAAGHGCHAWSVTFTSSGQRNVTPGQATTVHGRAWAGYVVKSAGARITEATGSWVQSAVRCTGSGPEFSSFWVGIDGWGNGTVEQAGTEADCSDGQPTYSAWWETFPDPEVPVSLAVKPGDQMRASITSVGERYTMSLRDETTGKGFSRTADWPKAEGTSAEWIAEATSRCSPDECVVQVLPDFGVARFGDAAAATATSGLLPPTDPSWQLERSVMITRGGRTKAEVSPFGADGESFSVSWRQLS